MLPRLGKKYEIQTEVISKPRAEFQTDEYFELDLPVAPAVMVDDEIVVEGSDVAEDKLENVIRAHLGLEPMEPEKKGLLGRLFGR
ncbi:MAG: hypothetical protein HY879_15280 [Deltaproteobacteria bacterium]|nr:hypothetical protein [Deltaproteobacteria bacterium]